MTTPTQHARAAAEAFDAPSRDLVGYSPTGDEVLEWFAKADLVVVSQVRLRWFIDKLTDTRLTADERVGIVANHPFWRPYRELPLIQSGAVGMHGVQGPSLSEG
ncbi:hypothetical protein [uncultured Methylobacterium sp.]|uniref:hypothetical protein n=1 Tax=uncultured Methylobacterium sp. TaxID=157278 RepID=UPI0035CAA516